jgi:hypothetical protein
MDLTREDQSSAGSARYLLDLFRIVLVTNIAPKVHGALAEQSVPDSYLWVASPNGLGATTDPSREKAERLRRATLLKD